MSVRAFAKEKKRKDGEDDRRSAIAESIRSRTDVCGTAHNYTDVIRTSGDVTYLLSLDVFLRIIMLKICLKNKNIKLGEILFFLCFYDHKIAVTQNYFSKDLRFTVHTVGFSNQILQ